MILTSIDVDLSMEQALQLQSNYFEIQIHLPPAWAHQDISLNFFPLLVRYFYISRHTNPLCKERRPIDPHRLPLESRNRPGDKKVSGAEQIIIEITSWISNLWNRMQSQLTQSTDVTPAVTPEIVSATKATTTKNTANLFIFTQSQWNNFVELIDSLRLKCVTG